MKQFRSALEASLHGLAPQARGLFALLCAERLRSCCWAYQQVSGLDLAPFFEVVEESFDALASKQPSSVTSGSGLERIGPLHLPGGEPLAVQAQSGVICLIVALELMADKPAQVIDASNAAVDAVDNFEFFCRRRLTGQSLDPSDSYPLLVREKGRQNDDALFVKEWDLDRGAGLLERRIQNLQFSVPVAV